MTHTKYIKSMSWCKITVFSGHRYNLLRYYVLLAVKFAKYMDIQTIKISL